MKASLLVALAIAMFGLAPPAPAQETSRDIKIDEQAMIRLPQGWQIRNQDVMLLPSTCRCESRRQNSVTRTTSTHL